MGFPRLHTVHGASEGKPKRGTSGPLDLNFMRLVVSSKDYSVLLELMTL